MLNQCTMNARSAGSVRSRRISFSNTLKVGRVQIYIEEYVHTLFFHIFSIFISCLCLDSPLHVYQE